MLESALSRPGVAIIGRALLLTQVCIFDDHRRTWDLLRVSSRLRHLVVLDQGILRAVRLRLALCP